MSIQPVVRTSPDYVVTERTCAAGCVAASLLRTLGLTVGDLRWVRLTPRELEVARAIATGASNRQIACDLRMSVHTARRHTERVLEKLGVPSRAGVGAALMAYAAGVTLGVRLAVGRGPTGCRVSECADD